MYKIKERKTKVVLTFKYIDPSVYLVYIIILLFYN